MSDLVVEYFPLLDLPKDLLEEIALYNRASGYFLRLVCKSLVGVRSDIYDRTKAVLLEGNLDLFNLLPNRDCVELEHAVMGDSLSIVSLLDINCVGIDISLIRSVDMCILLRKSGAVFEQWGMCTAPEDVTNWLKVNTNLYIVVPEKVDKSSVTYIMSHEDVDVLSRVQGDAFVGYSALLALTGGTNHVERIKYLQSRGANMKIVCLYTAPSYEVLDWVRDNTTSDMGSTCYNIGSEIMLRWTERSEARRVKRQWAMCR